ncbi:hypothetical protein P7K49_018978 [Saguinus oedipus]|uniref:Uncharacterized protein n=1 Tax=Saguinus oedipus TaxID=9490 RepID=A0ABQ9UW46_SAGOE|nr:hypothetical protein P7K49_018978 [Saguinus oedipus]
MVVSLNTEQSRLSIHQCLIFDLFMSIKVGYQEQVDVRSFGANTVPQTQGLLGASSWGGVTHSAYGFSPKAYITLDLDLQGCSNGSPSVAEDGHTVPEPPTEPPPVLLANPPALG